MSDLLNKVDKATTGVWKVIKTIVSVLLLAFVAIVIFSIYFTGKQMSSVIDDKKVKTEQAAAQAIPSQPITQAPQAVITPAPAASLQLMSIHRIDNSIGLSGAQLKINAINKTDKTIKAMKVRITAFDLFGDQVISFTYKLVQNIEPTNGKIIEIGVDLNPFINEDVRFANLKEFKSSIEIIEMITE
jgi:hypothetical protein